MSLSPEIKRVRPCRKETKEARVEENGTKISKRGEERVSRKSRFPALSNLLLPRWLSTSSTAGSGGYGRTCSLEPRAREVLQRSKSVSRSLENNRISPCRVQASPRVRFFAGERRACLYIVESIAVKRKRKNV